VRLARGSVMRAVLCGRVSVNGASPQLSSLRKRRSSRAKARPAPKAASAASASSSRKPGSVHGAFISQIGAFCKEVSPDPPRRGGPYLNGSGLPNRIPLSPNAL
jgi:hypothetical protein